MADEKSFFGGNERLEEFPLIGRLIRKGEPSELGISDGERVRQAIQKNDITLAKNYLSTIQLNVEGLITNYCEFILAFAPALDETVPRVDFRVVIKHAYGVLSSFVESSTEFKDRSETKLFLDTFHPDKISLEAVSDFRQALLAGRDSVASQLIDVGVADFTAAFSSLNPGNPPEGTTEAAVKAFDSYFEKMRLIHDLQIEFLSIIIMSMGELHQQKAAEEVLRKALTGCLAYEGMWEALQAMSPEETAAFLAESFRSEFSGKNRGGVTQIIEEEDRYRLVFAPCGSGGVMRQRAVQTGISTPTFPEASPQTWSKKGEVPGFCTQCAVNELESMQRFGYPVLVTEFTPDHQKPCGWTIYKDPKLIPEKYFERLGFKKNPRQFKK